MRKILFTITLIALLLPAVASCTYAASSAHSRLSDVDGMLTAEERTVVEEALSEASELAEMGIYAIVYDIGNGYYAPGAYEMADRLGVDIDREDVIFLAVWKSGSGYYYELFTYGKAYGLISDDDADGILDDRGVAGIKHGRISDGITAYAEITASTVKSNAETRFTVTVVVSVLLGIGAGVGTVLGIYLHYKKKQKSPSYPLSKYARLELMHANDRFLGSSVTRTRINTSSGSRSGGGGGSGGSRGSR